MRRGEVWWAELPPPVKPRPVLLLSRNDAYEVRDYVTVAPVTGTIRRIAAEVALGRGDGMPKRCVVNLDSVQTIRKSVLKRRMTALVPGKIEAVNRALRFALGLA